MNNEIFFIDEELIYRSFGARILLEDAGGLNIDEHWSKAAEESIIRIISSRKATENERKGYERSKGL